MKEKAPVIVTFEDMKTMKAEDFFKSDSEKLRAA